MTATFPGIARNIGCHRNEIDLGGLGEQMAMKQRVVDYIVGHLAAIGVDHIFGVDGANIEDLYDAAFFSVGHHRRVGQARVLCRCDG